MLKIAYSGLLNAQIVLIVIWISSWKLYFSPRRQPDLEVAMPRTAPSRAQNRRRQLRHPHRQEAWEARRRGSYHSSLLLGQERLVPAALV